ncbi:hypothetical protein HYW73_03730 [Candidatus Nomurabacteria bacterium]|nr:hypothetical protein [Candidatus Nomurabacteria bacterium]
MNKILAVILVLAVVILGGYFLLKSGVVQAPNGEIEGKVEETPTMGMPVPGTNTPEMIVETESRNVIIIYTDLGYSSNTLNIKAGDTVTFENDSSLSMWPASAFHPTHAAYPTTGGCLGSTFDACRGILPGESWSFKFDLAGAWKYHDHLKPSYFGTVVVE